MTNIMNNGPPTPATGKPKQDIREVGTRAMGWDDDESDRDAIEDPEDEDEEQPRKRWSQIYGYDEDEDEDEDAEDDDRSSRRGGFDRFSEN